MLYYSSMDEVANNTGMEAKAKRFGSVDYIKITIFVYTLAVNILHLKPIFDIIFAAGSIDRVTTIL